MRRWILRGVMMNVDEKVGGEKGGRRFGVGWSRRKKRRRVFVS